MAFAVTPVAAKDGNGTVINGGVDFVDTSGAGTGPWIITKVLIDPNGINVQGVLSNGAAKVDLTSAAGTALSATVNGLKVDGSAVTQPVSGTFFQATQPVSVASLPLPTGAATSALQSTINTTLGAPMQNSGGSVTANLGTLNGAATAAKQPAPGTAGTPSADVISVQGVTSMTPLKVDGSGATQPISGTVTANQGGTWTVQPGNTANTTAWKVDGSAVTQPVSGTITTTPPANASTNVAQFGGLAVNIGTGAAGTGTPRVSVSNDSKVQTWDGTNTMAVKAASTQAVATDPSAVFQLNPNSPGILTAGTAGTPSAQVVSIQGETGMTPVQTSPAAAATGGYSFSHISTSTTTTVKSGAGTLHTININSLGTVASTITVFDNTAGSGTVIAVLNSLTIGQGCYTFDVAFATGLTLVTTGTVAPDVTVSYK